MRGEVVDLWLGDGGGTPSTIELALVKKSVVLRLVVAVSRGRRFSELWKPVGWGRNVWWSCFIAVARSGGLGGPTPPSTIVPLAYRRGAGGRENCHRLNCNVVGDVCEPANNLTKTANATLALVIKHSADPRCTPVRSSASLLLVHRLYD